jgi:aspartate/methionine/tyrosine aminotransferase
MRARVGEDVCTGLRREASIVHHRMATSRKSQDTVAVMKIEPFALERLQSTYENQVAFNLSESGVQPLTLGELIEDPAAREALLAEPLRYTQTNGTPPLRAAIAACYPGATPDHVQVTNGGAEANFITAWNLIEPGDEVVMMTPNFMQAWGLARAFGAVVKPWPLVNGRGQGRAEAARGEGGWTLDLDGLARLVSPRTRLIAICNPNNPTGARFDAGDLDSIAAIADRHGSWILSDEIYRGAERDGCETATIWGRSDRVIVTSGLSKAYGLPGLRIGWIVGPAARIESMWSYHDYTTIAPGALSDALARHALEPLRRERLLARTRGILNRNYPIISGWLGDQAGFSYTPPDAGAIVYARYAHAINSTELVTRLRLEKSLLIVPGDHFGMDGYLRLGFGDEPDHLRQALERLGDAMAEFGLRPSTSPGRPEALEGRVTD